MLKQKRVNPFPIALVLITCLSVIMLSGCSQQDKKAAEPSTEQSENEQTVIKTVIKPVQETEKPEPKTVVKPVIDPANAIAVIETDKGDIEFEFYANDAPKTSKNFILNASLGYYSSEKFHEVDELFIQAGSSIIDDTLPIEKSDHPLVKGAVLMAKEPGATVSDGDEFFICKDAIALDEDYTTLGKVTKGLEVLDSIAKNDKIVNIDNS